jgi:pimeloyl-ACP methyl ester carboxylesterase
VYNYARRGRGASGDTALYAVAREIDDLQALIGAAGGSAHVFGASSGGALALEAAAAGSAIDRIALYEVPYMSDATMANHWLTYVDALTVALARELALGRGRAVHAPGGESGGGITANCR